MTGEKNRYKPLDTLLKLDDEQLKTPKHDEMVLWLLNKENIKQTIPDEFKIINERIQTRRDELRKKITEKYQEIEKTKENDRLPSMISMEEWIECLKEEINDIEYELDLLNQGKRIDGKDVDNISIFSERPIKAQNGFIIGYWDIAIRIPWMGYTIYIEVKPKIPSFGATLRQLRTYESYLTDRKDKIFLFTEDLRFKDAFESQGIQVISPPERQTSLTEGGRDE